MIRKATVGDAELVAKLLHEFDTPVPDNLARRFASALARDDVVVVLTGEVEFVYLTLWPSPYYDGPVAMLEELYVAPAQRNRVIGVALMRRVLEEIEGAGEMQKVELVGDLVEITFNV